MNKTELVNTIAFAAGLKRKDAAAAVDAFTEIISAELKKNNKVQLPGFGTFEVARRNARSGKNPHTGEALEIPAHNVPKFKPGKSLKEAVNN